MAAAGGGSGAATMLAAGSWQEHVPKGFVLLSSNVSQASSSAPRPRC